MSTTEHATTVAIQHSAYRFWLAFGYALLALFSWIMMVILTYRPVTTRHYNDVAAEPQLYAQNQQWYTAVRVMQAIVAILTLPITSTVCSGAAVIYAQRCRPTAADKFTLPQLMMLADKGWADLRKIWKMMRMKNGWKQCGSRFLVAAMILNVLGLVIQPIQEIFLSSVTVRIPTETTELSLPLVDIPDRFGRVAFRDLGYSMIVTRKALETTDIDQVQSLLWGGSNASCTFDAAEYLLDSCETGGLSLRNMSQLPSAFLAPVPSGFNTGLKRDQFVPRINSTTSFEPITAAEFPSDCGDIPGAHYVHYSNSSVESNGKRLSWSLRACMPGDYALTPWKGTRDRQDFTEELYVEYTTERESAPMHEHLQEAVENNREGTRFRVGVATTGGYFELPNYANDLTPGPLMDRDPSRVCDPPCRKPNLTPSSPARETAPDGSSLKDVYTGYYEDFRIPEFAPNKGPLLTVALALFGPGSLPDRLLRSPNLYTNPPSFARPPLCVDRVPLGGLIPSLYSLIFNDSYTSQLLSRTNRCITDDNKANSMDIMVSWLANFNAQPEVIQNVFAAAAFLASQAWMLDNREGDLQFIRLDPGTESTKPVISTAGVIVVSVLLTVDLVGLLGLAMYAWVYPRWTDELDSRAMMRIGNVLGRKGVQLGLMGDGEMAVLHEMSGKMGDSEATKPVGRVALGATAPLRSKRKYTAAIE